ncbi:hypothetical protein H2199_000409 [Coniosporium tulheliwenetii]|uniref:Uncharacterized protein n=1 Tax=Coniosporium tulheliwenetii TaxID=3383036 RepID=A0ACC2ZPW3_9PEZI|nr:hypothetical protein H2199_000409 [Cladosporium sp. JES 115]
MTDDKRGNLSTAQATPSSTAVTSPASTPASTNHQNSSTSRIIWRRVYDILSWTPPRCRWDPEKPPVFSMPLNVLFGFAGAFTVANLYYNHPILNILAADFDVSYEDVAQIPTVMQAGYAAGLLFLCPLGDLFKRRAFVLLLVLFTATMWIGLCITKSLAVFTAISFITAITTVTPQLMLPLVGDLAPPNKRAAALSIVVSGLIMGILIARLLSGILTNYTSWRNVYWLSLGLQYAIFILLWLFMPDYPSTNPGGLNYFKMLWSILVMVTKHPVLVQACLISFFTAATFTNFWTTLTFLLAGEPYNYSSLIIGLFALIGIASMLLSPIYARTITDRFVPLFSTVIGELMVLTGVVVGTYTGTFTVAGPILQAFLNDLGMQSAQIANRSSIYAIEPKARNRVNTAFMLFTFCGQLTGTAAGNSLYARGAGYGVEVRAWGSEFVGWEDCGGAEEAGAEWGGCGEGVAEEVGEELAAEEGKNPLRRIRDEKAKEAEKSSSGSEISKSTETLDVMGDLPRGSAPKP